MNLKPLVNDKTLYKDFLEEIENRLSLVHTQLEQGAPQKKFVTMLMSNFLRVSM